MTKQQLARQAYEESCSPVSPAGTRPFWNAEAYQFLYVPAFQFQPIPGCKSYLYVTEDERGKTRSFTADSASASLTPVWGELPEGTVTLRVNALDAAGKILCPVGARTFFKLAPFPAELPGKVRSYGECAARAYDYAFEQPFLRHWLTEGTPDPHYGLNCYLTKMTASVIRAMLDYETLRPARAAEARKIAVNAADFLLSVSEPAGAPLEGLPPTYFAEKMGNAVSEARFDQIMMLYPASAGSAYLKLEAATGEEKYLAAARKIGEFYRDHVLENGSWFLLYDKKTGKPAGRVCCAPLGQIVPFLRALAARTGEGCWDALVAGAVAYTEKNMLASFNWEGQFEDAPTSLNYSNLTHFDADALAGYYLSAFPGDEEKLAVAEELARFAEDQFVVWHRAAPWDLTGFDTSLWLLPAGLEQYHWHVPIDSSTAAIMTLFLRLWQAGRGELWLAKARALADQLTRVQEPSGRIPTHWMNTGKDEGFWINCLFASAARLADMERVLKEDRRAEGI